MDIFPRPEIYWDPNELRGAHYQEVTPKLKAIPRLAKPDSVIEDSRPNILPPYQTSASVRILDLATTMTVTMLFSNNANDVIREAFFSFPLPSTCSLTKFRFHIGDDRVINGKVKPILKAEADFSGAIHNRKTAALIKQETAEIFTAALGNLPPNTKLRAEVSMVMMLKEKIPDRLPTRISTLCIPTYIAPRYGKPPMPHLQDTISSPDAQHELSIKVEAIFADEVIDVTSRTHEISYRYRRGPRPTGSWDVFVRGDSLSQEPSNIVNVILKEPLSVLDGDFVLDFVVKPSAATSVPHAYLEHHPTLHDHQALMLTIPSNILVDSRSKVNHSESEVIFLADLSGSMFSKRSSLKSAIKFFLNGLPVDRRFNIWSFGTTYSSLWPKSKAKSQRSLRQALDHIESEVEKNLGGTELLPALKAMLDSRSLSGPSMTTDILLLTDGEVWREEETIEFVNSAREHSGYRVRFFCLGIGDAVSHSLVEGIAKAGGGYAEVVPAKSQTGWEDRVGLMLKAALHTHIGPVKLDIGQETQGGFRPWAEASFLKSPTEISSLSPFVTNKVLMLFESTRLPINEATIRLTTTDSCGREQVYKINPNLFHSEEPLIHRLAARELLRDLEHGRHWLIHPNEESLRREGERIACKWSLVSKWTCLVAVEESQSQIQSDPLSDLVLDSTSFPNRSKLAQWIPDLLRPIRGPRATLASQKKISTHKKRDSGSSKRSGTGSDSDDGKGKGGGGSIAGPASPAPNDSGNLGEAIFTRTTNSSAETKVSEGRSQESGSNGNIKSHTAHQTEKSATMGSTRGNNFSFEVTPGHLEQGIELFGSPMTTLNDKELHTRPDTVERPCSIKRLVPAAKESVPTLPAPAPGLPRGVRGNDEDDLNKRALIQDLFRFQSFDGSFSAMPDAQQNLVEMFGDGIGSVLDDMLKNINALLPWTVTRSEKQCFDVALAVIIIALLRKHFVSCQVLWSRVGDNAETFVKDCLPKHSSVELEDLVRAAEAAIRGIKLRIKTRQDTYPPIPSTSVGRHGHSRSQQKSYPASIHNARKPMSSTKNHDPTGSNINTVMVASSEPQVSTGSHIREPPSRNNNTVIPEYLDSTMTPTPKRQDALHRYLQLEPQREGQAGWTHDEREVEQTLKLRSYSKG
ncbi:hypothetical protein BFJ72_g3184 [Fusarium proliferatum]|uniref:VWFA domain-containing protein n=1 Tax=Gibberella intermedia TaxID=948311 RepID=A0A420TVR2_GIBIN|nr:hypothetical protein BFJ72_g3184 [Fusarium proliferatum]